MAIDTLTATGIPSARTLEWLAGSDLLAGSTGSTTTGDLAALGPVQSTLDSALSLPTAEGGSGAPTDAAAEPANQAILETHAQLEEVGHENPVLNGPLHGLTGLGETVGLGHIGAPGNLVTDGVAAAAAGDTGSAPGLLADAADVVTASGTLANSVTGVATPGNGAVGSGGLLDPVTGAANAAILDTHAQLEDIGHQNPTLNGPIHGLTGLGETLGLGHIGAPGNLVTDVTTLPGALLNGGGVGALAPIVHDLGDAVTGLGSLVTSVAQAPGTAGGVLAPGGVLGPVAGLANGVVLDVHGAIEDVGHQMPVLNDTLHGVTALGETVGLGHLGTPGNLLTDVADAPGGLLGGAGTGAVTPILGDLGAAATAVGTLGGAVAGLGGGLGANPLGAGGPLGPVTGPANGGVGTVHGALEGVGHDVPALNGPVHDVIGLGSSTGLGQLGSPGNVLTDAAGLPGNVLAGTGQAAASALVADVGHVGDAAGSLVGHLASGDGIAFPPAAGGGDALLGALGDLAPHGTAPAPTGGADASGHIDLGLVTLAVGGHADAPHGTDPTPHSALPGLHALGI